MNAADHDLRSRAIELIRDVRAHLQYLAELGATHVEEGSASRDLLKEWLERAHSSSTTARDEEGVRGLPASPGAVSEAVVEEDTPEEEKPMASKRRSTHSVEARPERATEQPALFGDLPLLSTAPPVQDRTLDDIRTDVGDCTRCKLHRSRTTIVFGEGDPRARIMFVGEGPGAEEDAQGRPFVGRAGQLLNRMIEAMGFRREEVYITNVVMCRPPNNRTPEPDEIATCEPFLFRKIRVIKPDVVVALGAIAAQSLLGTKAPIGQIRGRFFDAHGTKVLPTFHPAFLLRAPERKREAWEDLKKVRDYVLSRSRSEDAAR
ncbi:MAG: uracil-DNA glycosylase [Acidobacteriota bacterium]|nr:uracil-DNA glycosylase [Acidobacteriota bacterium]MDW8256873.1 uracil-DNA glycosylase [Acidobacteriota bacterium]